LARNRDVGLRRQKGWGAFELGDEPADEPARYGMMTRNFSKIIAFFEAIASVFLGHPSTQKPGKWLPQRHGGHRGILFMGRMVLSWSQV